MSIYRIEEFAGDCREMGIDLSEKQFLQFEKYYELLTECVYESDRNYGARRGFEETFS